MFKLTTFDAEGNLLHSGYGVFTGTDGTCIATWEAFQGASKANIIDAQGRKYDVDCLIGVDEIYNISKFRVIVPSEKKMAITPINVAKAQTAVGGESWLVGYDVKAPTLKKCSPSNVETFQKDLPYYIFEDIASEDMAGSPMLNANGELLGLIQPSKKRTDIYCPSAQYAVSMTVSGITSKQATMQLTNMRVALPDDFNQAVVALMMNQGQSSSDKYLGMAEEFISKFPNSPEGYNAKAVYLTNKGQYAEAAKVMEEDIAKVEKKDEAHFDYSKLMFNKLVYTNDSTFTDWTFDTAVAEADAAMAVNPLPAYNFHKGNILFAEQKYEDAYNVFMDVTKTNMRGPESFYNAYLCQKALNAPQEKAIELLDSTLACFSQPYPTSAAKYLLERAEMLNEAGQARKASIDYSEYEQLMQKVGIKLNGRFYYTKEQAELKAKFYQQAIEDINKAVDNAPGEQTFYAEKALLYVRVNKLDEGMQTAKYCMTLFPEYGDGYAVYGLAQVLKGQKKEGQANLKKAKELGSEMADSLIAKYCK